MCDLLDQTLTTAYCYIASVAQGLGISYILRYTICCMKYQKFETGTPSTECILIWIKVTQRVNIGFSHCLTTPSISSRKHLPFEILL